MSEADNNNNNGKGTDTNEGSADARTYSQDYVKTLREENKEYRLRAKHYETHLRDVMGIDSATDLSDLSGIVKGHKDKSAKQLSDAMASATNMLVSAEIKSLGSGYDVKLVGKLLDKSKLTIENGEIKGLKEALVELEKEFPVIKTVTSGKNPGSNPASAGSAGSGDEWEVFAKTLY